MPIQLHKISVKTHRTHYGPILVDFTYFIFIENGMHVVAYVQRSLAYIFNNAKLERFRGDHVRYQSDPCCIEQI